MGKLSIYSKTRSQLRRDLAQAGINAKPIKEVKALAGSIDSGTTANSLSDGDEEEAV